MSRPSKSDLAEAGVCVTNRTEKPQTFSFESPDKSAEIVVVVKN